MNKAVTAVVVRKVDSEAVKVVVLHSYSKRYANMAVYCAAAAGALMVQKKNILEFGKFTKWIEAVAKDIGVTVRSCQNYMVLAETMAEKIKALPKTKRVSFLPSTASQNDLPMESILMLLGQFDPGKTSELLNEQVAGIMKDVTNEQSMRQLYFDWEIVKPSKHGGYHPADPNKIRVPSDPEKEAITSWKEFSKTLYDHGVKRKTWANLPNKEFCNLFDLFDLIHSQMRDAVKRIKTVKK